MKQLPFEPPTDYYDERMATIDEQICQLIQQRKELSDNNPGFPKQAYIAEWARKYGFYEEFLNSVFSSFLFEEMHKPNVEPMNFQKNIPILKSFENDDNFYTVLLVRQFENASRIYLNVTSKYADDPDGWQNQEHPHFQLSVEGHECRAEGGGGGMGHETYSFTVSPALPDDKTKYELVFTGYKTPFNKDEAFEFII